MRTRKTLALVLTVLFWVSVAADAGADTLSGRVVHIRDGDTLEILDSAKQTITIRIGGMDAPEHNQPFGARAKQRLADLVGAEDVVVEPHKLDRHGRTVGTVFLDGADIGLAMVRAGLAWWYRAYANEQSIADRERYEAAENDARNERRGLWKDARPMPPWEYRHQPAPVEGYQAHCPCGSGVLCTGARGGRFCVTETGSKRYQHGATDQSDR